MTVDNIKIFPSIGIARLGNSPPDWPINREDKGEWFVRPEIPGDHTPPSGGYKDSKFRVKRQAARFRLFGYEAGSTVAKEITLANADIKWTVDLANTKAEWYEFVGWEKWKKLVGWENPEKKLPKRNASVPEDKRKSLCITPGARTLDSTESITIQAFDTGTFGPGPNPLTVPLGEMRTDSDGHLLVLGGFGTSGKSGKFPSPDNDKELDFANNDDWYDDVSDGPVNASVRFKGTNTWIQASSAWVICAPPKFVPPIEHIITLYDTLLQSAVKRGVSRTAEWLPPDKPSFTKDIYPILSRAMNVKWITMLDGVKHTKIQAAMPIRGVDPNEQGDARRQVFKYIRSPNTDPHKKGMDQKMPALWSDYYDRDNLINEALTDIQYHILEQWRDGNFDNDWFNPPTAERDITPKGLTRAALEGCAGGPLYPGIETSYITRECYEFVEPFRLNATLRKPGDLTKQMAIPWQADFFDCAYEESKDGDRGLFWWPMHRPNDVFPIGGGPQKEWIRDEDGINSRYDFVQKWHNLGFIIQQDDQYVETERNP